jgi:hypothetical protein
MKKVMMMAMMFVASATAFAGDSDALKAITKSKNYAEAAKLVQSSLGQLADNSEKAKAYNHLVDLAMDKVSKETGTIAENMVAKQTGGKEKPVDQIGLADALSDAIDMAIECNKYDQLPNAKGKVSPKFEKKNAERIWGVRHHLVTIGQEEAQKGNSAAVLKYWGAFTDSANDPMFASQDHKPEAEYAGQVAYFAGRYAFEAKDFARADRYLEAAMKDPSQRADAENYRLWAMRSNLKTHEDSVACINQLKALYEKEPNNDTVLDVLNSMYDSMKDRKAQTALLDGHLAKFPNSFAALAGKGLMAMSANDAPQAIEWLKKASAAKPDNAVIYTYLGICYNQQGATTEDPAKRKEFFMNAVEVFDKAKQYDPNRQMSNWGYPRYQAYYALYGDNDPRTKAAEADK